MDADKLAELAVAALDDLKAVNTVTVDVRELTDVMDYLVITSGTSSRHVKSLADNVSVEAKKADLRPLGVEGEDAGEWVLVDFGDAARHARFLRPRASLDQS